MEFAAVDLITLAAGALVGLTLGLIGAGDEGEPPDPPGQAQRRP